MTAQTDAHERIGVLIADDDEVYLATLAVLLETGGPIDVVGRAKNGREAVDLARELRPDAVVLDVQMPAMDGLEATRRITRELADVAVVVVSGAGDGSYADRAKGLGANAFISKSEVAESLIAALVSPDADRDALAPSEAGACLA